MDQRRIKLLHVEDNLAHRRLVGHYLSAIQDFAFDVFHADSEAAAVESFQSNGIDCVLLDYHLSQGDGLSCLRRLRESDPLVPIIALSGAATPEIASELLEVGADDYLAKQDLNRDRLAESLRAAILRAELVKQGAPAAGPRAYEKSDELFDKAAKAFVSSSTAEMALALDEFEKAARSEKLTLRRLQEMFTRLCDQVEANTTSPAEREVPAAKRMRPLLLEAILRVYGNLPITER